MHWRSRLWKRKTWTLFIYFFQSFILLLVSFISLFVHLFFTLFGTFLHHIFTLVLLTALIHIQHIYTHFISLFIHLHPPALTTLPPLPNIRTSSLQRCLLAHTCQLLSPFILPTAHPPPRIFYYIMTSMPVSPPPSSQSRASHLLPPQPLPFLPPHPHTLIFFFSSALHTLSFCCSYSFSNMLFLLSSSSLTIIISESPSSYFFLPIWHRWGAVQRRPRLPSMLRWMPSLPLCMRLLLCGGSSCLMRWLRCVFLPFCLFLHIPVSAVCIFLFFPVWFCVMLALSSLFFSVALLLSLSFINICVSATCSLLFCCLIFVLSIWFYLFVLSVISIFSLLVLSY